MPGAVLVVCSTCVLFALCTTGPGFLLVRRFQWSPAEKLSGAFALSILIISGATFGIRVAGLPPATYWVVAILCVGTCVPGRADWRALALEPEARAVGVAYASVASWFLGLTALIRNLSGGPWITDWVEHYRRSRFFLHHLPPGTMFLHSPVPARPPLMNLVCSFFMGIVGDDFSLYQVICGLLAAAIVFPVFTLARRVAGPRPLSVIVITGVIAFDPAIIQNATYPWTKLFAAILVSIGVSFYVSALDSGTPARLRLAVCALAAGVVTHYSAVPYALMVAIHFLFRGRRKFAAPAWALTWSAVLTGVVLAPWFLWSAVTYGPKATLGASGQVAAFESMPGAAYFSTAFGNMFNTIIPYVLRGVPLEHAHIEGAEPWTRLHDATFMIYQTNVLLLLGSGGLIVAVGALSRAWNRAGEERLFWVTLCGTAFVVGIGAVGLLDEFGLAHLALQPVAVMGLAFVAGSWSESAPWVRAAACVGMLVDLVLGIGLHILAEARDFAVNGAPPSPADNWRGVSVNWAVKMEYRLTFLGDALAWARPVIVPGLLAGALLLLWRLWTLNNEKT